MESLDIPGSVEKISQYNGYTKGFKFIVEDITFKYCESLLKLKIQHSLNPLQAAYGEFEPAFWDSWTETIKELFIDRELEYDIPVSNLVKLEIGESVKKVQVDRISAIETLDTIYSYAKVPPTLPTMSNKQYMNMIVRVPADALDAYRAADSWKNFWNLSGMESSGINDVKMDISPKIIGRYNINGIQVDESYKGITIVRFSDGSIRKYINNVSSR